LITARVVVGSFAAILVAVALQSCTAVLGMERATLEVVSDGSAGVPSGDDPNTSPCVKQPTETCTQCMEGCGTVYANCVDDPECRAKLDGYARCIGVKCDAAASKDCGRKTLGTLAGCFSACAEKGECLGTMLATSCELYCGCMPTCQSFLPAGWDCFKECGVNSATAGLVDCERSHCELGKGREDHCGHALGIATVCADSTPDPNANCPGRRAGGWYCEFDSDCCSNTCNPSTSGGGSCE
jgi:hypothetical protein